MSTKIYDGLLIRSSTLAGAIDRIRVLRKAAEQTAGMLLDERIAAEAAKHLDRQFLGLAPPVSNDSPLGMALTHALDEQAKVRRESRRSPSYDMEAKVVIFPERIHPEGYLAILYAEQSAHHQLVFGSSDVIRFGYWNNTDRPDDVSEHDWSVRQEMWEKALASGVPSLDGVTAQLVLETFFCCPDASKTERLANQHIQRVKRASALSQEIALKESGILDRPGTPMSEVMGFLVSEQARQQATRHAARLICQLPRYTGDELVGKTAGPRQMACLPCL